MAIRLSVHSREQIESFTEHVRTLPGVISIFHVTGQTDYLLWVAAADAHDLREFVVDHPRLRPRGRATPRPRSSTSSGGPGHRRWRRPSLRG